jgi:hypothetical protein
VAVGIITKKLASSVTIVLLATAIAPVLEELLTTLPQAKIATIVQA